MSNQNSAQNSKKMPKNGASNIKAISKTENVNTKTSALSAISSTISSLTTKVNQRKKEKQEELENSKMPSWKHRRRFIYMTFVLGVSMILFGALTYTTDTQVASQLVIGGVALISIIVTAYTGFAAFEDVHLWNQPARFDEGSTPPNEYIHGEEKLRD